MKKFFIFLTACFIAIFIYVLLDTSKNINHDRLNKIQTKIAGQKTIVKEEEIQLAKQVLSNLIKIKTIRDHETTAAIYLQQILQQNEIESQIFFHPDHPQRGNLIAELKGFDSQKPGLILLSHLDVVDANADDWQTPPFSGEITNDKVIGRGAIDMKGMATMELITFLALKKSQLKLKRNVLLLAVANEENGGALGAKYMLENHPELFDGYKYLINEGGVGIKDFPVPGAEVFNIQFAEKGVLQIKATASHESAHGSSPPSEYSVTYLLNFINELKDIFSKTIVSENIQPFFYQMGEMLPLPKSFFLKRVGNPLVQKIVNKTLKANRHLASMTSNSFAITGLKTNEGTGYNVIPAQAEVKIDIRSLPEVTPQSLLATIDRVASRHKITIEVIETNKGTKSDFENELFYILGGAAKNLYPKVAITPFMSAGATDSRFFREKGMVCFGLIPSLFTLKEIDGLHGPNEQISIQNLISGIQILKSSIFYFTTN